MKIWFAAATAATFAFSIPCEAHGGVSSGGFGHAMSGAHIHGPVFLHPRPFFPFHQPHVRFGHFRQRNMQSTVGYGGDDYDDNYDDDAISNLHFRVQEPFGPGDIGRPPVGAEAEGPYMGDRFGPPPGYEPEDR